MATSMLPASAATGTGICCEGWVGCGAFGGAGFRGSGSLGAGSTDGAAVGRRLIDDGRLPASTGARSSAGLTGPAA